MRFRSRFDPVKKAGLLTLAAIGLLLASCATRVPLQEAETLQLLERRLLAEEAEVYLPEETGRLRSEIQSILRVDNFVPTPDLLGRPSSLEGRIEQQIYQAYSLLAELSSLRSRLQEEQQSALGFLRTHLVQQQGYRDYPELNRLAADIEQKLPQSLDFSRPGAYQHNLALMREVGELFTQLQFRWLRYNGGPRSVEEVEQELALYRQQLESLRPTGRFIVIDTALNRLEVKEDDRVLLEAVCSTGSGHKLVTPEQEWSFHTPRGEFEVRHKLENPVWRKPDWAFIEAGEPIPKRDQDRIEYGALGKYALAFGEGYFIHGTLYTRLLGQAVTHGCVRVGADDLAELNELVPIGAKIYIF